LEGRWKLETGEGVRACGDGPMIEVASREKRLAFIRYEEGR
jgi:hypothetical protein